MTWDKELLKNCHEIETPEMVVIGDGLTLDALEVGNVPLKMFFKVSQPKESVMYKCCMFHS